MDRKLIINSAVEVEAPAGGRQQRGLTPPVSDERPPVAGAIIEARQIHKRYNVGHENEVHALRGASLSINAGEMAAIMGPSGSGKSTLMHILGCLDRLDSGEVLLRGGRIDNLSRREVSRLRSRQVGFIFQGFNLIPSLSAEENVALAAEYGGMSRRASLPAAREALIQLGLGGRLDHRPSELSGGQQQRVAIARALINRPLLVLGDEPTGDLDTATSDEIVSLMRDINRSTGTTFVLVTHNPEVGQACGRTIFMRDGLVLDGH